VPRVFCLWATATPIWRISRSPEGPRKSEVGGPCELCLRGDDQMGPHINALYENMVWEEAGRVRALLLVSGQEGTQSTGHELRRSERGDMQKGRGKHELPAAFTSTMPGRN